ncbi:hypothetical protein QA612_06050 [Evansella sp. AB-P1]|uniref:hypothetical protein n=1 Tax=Evansella sp. AB-P1 TaxID=3037653 RepID=UPI00241DB064|nr:hypothetical protein [Evansella sp. AB-P1]MDG5787048.1 hypothetical protein [Evansella sp. AB-P1]
MKSKLGLVSIILFFVGLIAFMIAYLLVISHLLIIGAIASGMGFVLALFAEKDRDKKRGLIGNGILLIFAIFPFIVRILYWTGP